MSLDLRFLTGVDLFRGLDAQGMKKVCAFASVIDAVKDDLIFRQGDDATCAYALAEGSIRIVQSGGDGGQTIIRFIAPGEMFGTVPLFTNHHFPADAIAAERSRVVTWSEEKLFALIHQYPQIAMNMIKIIGARLEESQTRLRELSTQRAEQRIAHTLQRLASQASHTVDGAISIDIPLRRKDLAEASGVTLHTASRILTGWRKAGILTSHDQRLTIHDLKAIARITDR